MLDPCPQPTCNETAMQEAYNSCPSVDDSVELSQYCNYGSPIPPGQQLLFSTTVTEFPDLEKLLSANGSLSCQNVNGTNLENMEIAVVSEGTVCGESDATVVIIPVSTTPD